MAIVLDGSGGITTPATHSGNFVGQVCFFALNSAPSGFLKANGASLSTTTYATLFAVIGYTFGGSGASFNLPDLRGEFLRGWDDARSVDSGRSFGSAQSDAFGSHNHIGGWPRANGYPYQNARYGTVIVNETRSVSNATSAFASTAYPYTSTDGDTETRPRNVALLACIKY